MTVLVDITQVFLKFFNASDISEFSLFLSTGTSEMHVPMKKSNDIWTLLENQVSSGSFSLELPIATAAGLKTVSFI